MKKILIASGCSYTDNQFRSACHPEMDTSWPKWPEIVAKELDMICINLGRSGSGNEYIYSSIHDIILRVKDKSQIGLVIAGWSQCFRQDWQTGSMSGVNEKMGFESDKFRKATPDINRLFEFTTEQMLAAAQTDIILYSPNGHGEKYNNGDMKKPMTIHDRLDETFIKKAAGATGWMNDRVMPHGDILGWVRKSLRTYIDFQTLCEYHNIPYMQTQMIPMYIDFLRGLMPTEQEVEMGIGYGQNSHYLYDGHAEEDEQSILKIILEYDSLINHDKFLGWPISRKLGGSPMNFEALGGMFEEDFQQAAESDARRNSPNYISVRDGHPSKAGQELIAKSFLENYEKTYS